jgi:hypothetical protein
MTPPMAVSRHAHAFNDNLGIMVSAYLSAIGQRHR